MCNLIVNIIEILVLYLLYVETCQWSPAQCGCAQVPPSIKNRIVGGTEAIPYSWPVSQQTRHLTIIFLFKFTFSGLLVYEDLIRIYVVIIFRMEISKSHTVNDFRRCFNFCSIRSISCTLF